MKAPCVVATICRLCAKCATSRYVRFRTCSVAGLLHRCVTRGSPHTSRIAPDWTLKRLLLHLPGKGDVRSPISLGWDRQLAVTAQLVQSAESSHLMEGRMVGKRKAGV
jgi:hypothetical protein